MGLRLGLDLPVKTLTFTHFPVPQLEGATFPFHAHFSLDLLNEAANLIEFRGPFGDYERPPGLVVVEPDRVAFII